MVELRKRKAPPPPPPPAKKKATPKTKAKATAPAPTAPIEEKKDAAAAKIPKPNPDAPKILLGYTLTLDGFGGEVQTNDEKKVTLAKLVEESKEGVVLFTYPKASTPGCTTQVCLFRDDYAPLTAAGLSIFGLSNDSPKANTSFKTKQNLPYALLCDPDMTLIEAIGMKKVPKGTTRGVFVVDKSGKVLAVEAGGPARTLDVVREVIAKKKGGETAVAGTAASASTSANGISKTEDKLAADTAAEVADSAAKLDKSKPSTPLPA